MNLSEMTARVRRPEYTGENRCVPCTVVNAVLAAAGALVLGVLAAPWLGAVALVAASGVIYLRGYLVPGTPTLTKRYFPPWLLRWFGKDPVVATDEVAATDDADTQPLVAGGVLTAADDPALTAAFRDDWNERTTTLVETGVEASAVAAAFDADSVSRLGETSFVLDGNTSVRWGSTAALAADVAGATLLEERVDAWASFDRDRRRSTLRALRLLLHTCPTCAATLTVDSERVDPCCQKPHLVAESVCPSCGAVVADAAVVDTGEVDSVPAALLDW